MELGAFTVFLYMIKAREYLWELVEMVTGARLTVSYCRVGGVKADLPEGFADRCRKALEETRKVLADSDALLTRNRIFVDRMSGTGRISPEDAISYGITGPFLRATGVDYDVRKDCPYAVYDRLQFDVPVGTRGDNFDRYLVRMEEMEQSMRIVEQALRDIPGGPFQVSPETGRPVPASEMVDQAKVGNIPAIRDAHAVTDPTLEGSAKPLQVGIAAPEKRVFLPAKEDTYGNIEGLMQHFKLVMYGHGVRPPKGEVYFPVEGANGELGFYVVSDGNNNAYRVRVRPPCFAIMSALPKLLIGDMMADLTPTFGSVNMIVGELDRCTSRGSSHKPGKSSNVTMSRGRRCCRSCGWCRRTSATFRRMPSSGWEVFWVWRSPMCGRPCRSTRCSARHQRAAASFESARACRACCVEQAMWSRGSKIA